MYNKHNNPSDLICMKIFLQTKCSKKNVLYNVQMQNQSNTKSKH